MKFIKTTLLIAITILLNSGCYASMSGTVVDTETGKPIEGTVVLVNWTMTKGVPGLTYGEDYKTVEAITDKEGKFRVFGVLNPFVNPPTIVVYKKGYVAWRNDFIFPDYKKRENFQWTKNYVFKLEHFKRYSHSRHISFLSMSGLSLSSTKLEQTLSWELPMAGKEDELYNKKLKTLKSGESNKDIWEEVVKELYGTEGDVNE